MTRRPFSNAALAYMRGIGDPKLEAAVSVRNTGKYFGLVASEGLDAALEQCLHKREQEAVWNAVEADAGEAVAALRSYGVEPTVAITRARERFMYFGDEISASLLLAALPDSYATAWGARVLVAHGDLVWALPRRVRQTALFLMTVMSNYGIVGSDAPDETIIRTCGGLRLFHHVVRSQLREDDRARAAVGDENATPINQEDLLGTLLSFSVTTFNVLDQFGVNWSDDDREAYLVFWDVVGAALGIGTRIVYERLSEIGIGVSSAIRPQTVDAATRLLDQLHARQWEPVPETIEEGRPFPWSGLVPGRMLVDALIAALTEAMPASRKMWPTIVMRELAPTIVQRRLGLDGTGLSSYATRWVAQRSRHVKSARSATLRMMANEITRHAMQSFLRAEGPPFVVPGLDLRELTGGRPGQPFLELKPGGAASTK